MTLFLDFERGGVGETGSVSVRLDKILAVRDYQISITPPVEGSMLVLENSDEMPIVKRSRVAVIDSIESHMAVLRRARGA